MANVTGQIKLWRKEIEKDGNEYVFYSTTIGNKDKDGNYVNAYLDVVFPTNEPKTAYFSGKDDMNIDLKDAFLSTRKRGERVSLVLVVTKWAKVSQSKVV